MNAHQARVVAIAKKRLEALATSGGIELRHRDAGRSKLNVEIVLRCEEDGHAFMARTVIGWWAQKEKIEMAIERLVRELHHLHVNPVAELRMFGYVISKSLLQREVEREGK